MLCIIYYVTIYKYDKKILSELLANQVYIINQNCVYINVHGLFVLWDIILVV